MKDRDYTNEPITLALKRLMRERRLTFRALAALTQSNDAEARGVTYAYLCGLSSGREHPSRRTLELLASAFQLPPAYFAEYRLAELRRQLDEREVGFAAAYRTYQTLSRRRPIQQR